jgi:hypothetical protein
MSAIFRERRKSSGSGVQQHLAYLFAAGGSTGLARNRDGKPVSAQRPRQLLQLRALAATIESFKSYKFSASHLRDDSRQVGLRLSNATQQDFPS